MYAVALLSPLLFPDQLENWETDSITSAVLNLEFRSDRETEAIQGLALQIFIGVEVLAGGINVAMAEAWLGSWRKR
jgi:hypothetical protein